MGYGDTNTSQHALKALVFGVQFSSVKYGSYALWKAHMRPTTSLRHFVDSGTFETVQMFVSLTMALFRPFKEDRLALPFSTPLSSRRSVV